MSPVVETERYNDLQTAVENVGRQAWNLCVNRAEPKIKRRPNKRTRRTMSLVPSRRLMRLPSVSAHFFVLIPQHYAHSAEAVAADVTGRTRCAARPFVRAGSSGGSPSELHSVQDGCRRV